MSTRLSNWRVCLKKTKFLRHLNTIKQQLQWASGILSSISCSARLDSEVLLAHCLQKDRSYLLTWPDNELTDDQQACFQDLVRRRLQPQPVAYLVGYREFYSMSLMTTADTLVPRPETEMLVDAIVELTKHKPDMQILDLGTGTGAVALAIKKHAPLSRVSATDYSTQALKVAETNATNLGLDIQFIEADWYKGIEADPVYDCIVSNPPYIAAKDPCLRQGDLPAEPLQALSSGESGLEALEIIIPGAVERLKPGGHLFLEHGFEQAAAVREMLQKCDFQGIITVQDFSGLDRMTQGRRSLNNTE